jgi:hypothetical protein
MPGIAGATPGWRFSEMFYEAAICPEIASASIVYPDRRI